MLVGPGQVGLVGRQGALGNAGVFNFLSGTLDPRITFTRASNATEFSPSGSLITATTNEPRFDYNPLTLQPRGLLLEGARTNLVLNSATLVTQNVTVTAVAHTLSFYGTGSVTLSGVATGTLNGTGVFPNRAQLTFTPAAGTLTLTVTGTVSFAQLELGAFASSYIPTTGAAATRADDSALNTILSSIGYNQAQGTIVIELEPMVTTLAAFQIPFSITNGTANNRIILEHTTAGNGSWRVTDGGVAQVAGLAATPGFTANSITKRAFAYAANDFAACANGGTVVTQGTGTVPSNLNQLAIGHYAVGSVNSPWFGWIRRITYYPTRLPNATLQALST